MSFPPFLIKRESIIKLIVKPKLNSQGWICKEIDKIEEKKKWRKQVLFEISALFYYNFILFSWVDFLLSLVSLLFF